MYQHHNPIPIIIPLTGEAGFQLRERAARYAADHLNRTGAERGSTEQQGFGVLAEMVIRGALGMSEAPVEDHPIGFDLSLPSGVKVDVKCRGGTLPFQERYESDDGIAREAKHNFFARQLHDEQLDADVYLMTHLETPSRKRRSLPGTRRQRKWKLYICGWVSKIRALRDGVYLPRGSLTEQGRTWFTYSGQEIEFYHRHLNGLSGVRQLLEIEASDVGHDVQRHGDLHLTTADAMRIMFDLVGRGLLDPGVGDGVRRAIGYFGRDEIVKPILHTNQYLHFLAWLKDQGIISLSDEQRAATQLPPGEPFQGI